MAGLMALARDHDLKVIEDCAQSFGARHHGRATGTIGHAGAFSFFPSKNLGACGDGGLLATDDDRLAETARMLRVHGSRRKYHNEMVGCNSRLDELQAAILRLKLPRLDGWNRSRRQAAATYNRLLAGQDGIRLPSLVDGHVFHQYTVQLPGGGRDQIRALLDEDGICTMVYYPIPCHRLEVYRGSHAEVSCPHAERLAGQVLSLPLWPDMEEDVQVEVAHGLLLAISSIEQTADRRG
jgi:dTDP-4-amino-4,6-dideoxygalactose transaminase